MRIPRVRLSSLQWEKAFVRFLSVESIFYLLFAFRFFDQAQRESRTVFLAFHVLRLIVILMASLLEIIRRADRYYLPVVTEMSGKTYWRTVFFLVIILRVPFLRYFQFPGLFGVIDSLANVLLASFVVFSLAVLYHQRYWAREYETMRQARIEQLRAAGRITKKELDTVTPLLIEIAADFQRTPRSWLLVQIVFSFIIGLLVTIVSANITDLIVAR